MDSIVMMVHGGHYGMYDESLKELYKHIFDVSVMSALAAHRTVVLDRTYLTRASRAKMIEMAKVYKVPIIGVEFAIDDPVVHANRRYMADNRGHSFNKWWEVALRHRRTYEKPNVAEGFTDLIYPFEEIEL